MQQISGSSKFNSESSIMKTCSIFILAVAFMTLVMADESPKNELQENMEKFLKECNEENAVTPLSLCIHHKLGIQELNGDIDKDRLRATMQRSRFNDVEFIEKVMAECGDRKGATAAEAAVALKNCMEKNIVTRYPGITFKH